MITPRFSLSQDDDFLKIIIRAPYCNLKELETYIEGNDFRFVCTPYYLRLNLPGKIIDNNASSGEFLADSGEFVFKYSKLNKGEHFEGLDFITSLLKPAKKKNTEPNIEVLSETNEFSLTTADQEGNEWHLDQQLPEENGVSLTNICKYGFANQKYNVLNNTESEFYSVFDLHNVDEMPITERKHLRYDTESMEFSPEHFLADYFDNEIINSIIEQSHPWTQFTPQNICFDAKEKDILKDLPNREYLLNKEELKSVLYSLIDILYAYCYDKRTTDFESTCESGWTVTKITATLSWFDVFTNETETITSGFRRSLIYPLYRNFDLSCKVLEDLKILLNLGPVFIVKCLLDMYDIFGTSPDPRYIINDLYIKDYIIFMQKCPKNDLDEIIRNVKEIKISKDDINLNLNKIIETAIRGSIKGDSIMEKMSKLNITNEESDSSESDSDSDSSDESSSEDTSSSDSDDTDSESTTTYMKN